MSTCAGLKRQNRRRQMGVGSQTEISQTSRDSSACARDSAVVESRISERKRRGEEDIGEASTRTRRADGVEGAMSTDCSKSR